MIERKSHKEFAAGEKIIISNLNGNAAGDSAFGTMGCCACKKHLLLESHYVISSYHVFYANNATKGSAVYCINNKKNSSGQFVLSENDVFKIATLSGNGYLGNYKPFCKQNDEQYYLDCGIALISKKIRLRMIQKIFFRKTFLRWKEKQLQIGTAICGDTVYRGDREGKIKGTIKNANAIIRFQDGTIAKNVILIRAVTNDPFHAKPFATASDSGTLVYNENSEVVGLIWGINLNNTVEAYACHIEPLMERLQLDHLYFPGNQNLFKWNG